MMEIKIGIAKEDLEAFHKASRGMNQAMTYGMSNAIKKVMKGHKGAAKVTKAFLDTLENVGSFRKDKIPLSLLKRMFKKRYITATAFGGSGSLSHQNITNVSLKKNDHQTYSRLKMEYQEFLQKKKREQELKKDEATIEPIKKAASTMDRISKILEAFVVKVSFNLRKLVFAVTDDRAKVKSHLAGYHRGGSRVRRHHADPR